MVAKKPKPKPSPRSRSDISESNRAAEYRKRPDAYSLAKPKAKTSAKASAAAESRRKTAGKKPESVGSLRSVYALKEANKAAGRPGFDSAKTHQKLAQWATGQRPPGPKRVTSGNRSTSKAPVKARRAYKY